MAEIGVLFLKDTALFLRLCTCGLVLFLIVSAKRVNEDKRNLVKLQGETEMYKGYAVFIGNNHNKLFIGMRVDEITAPSLTRTSRDPRSTECTSRTGRSPPASVRKCVFREFYISKCSFSRVLYFQMLFFASFIFPNTSPHLLLNVHVHTTQFT